MVKGGLNIHTHRFRRAWVGFSPKSRGFERIKGKISEVFEPLLTDKTIWLIAITQLQDNSMRRI